ncbi:hypothetical protein GYMC10_0735 [Paenibacillus sp. Y412MC10]|nr:hypothetical protein GYMC10_0735 [Paenibacillus sp. Y412MC10]
MQGRLRLSRNTSFIMFVRVDRGTAAYRFKKAEMTVYIAMKAVVDGM